MITFEGRYISKVGSNLGLEGLHSLSYCERLPLSERFSQSPLYLTMPRVDGLSSTGLPEVTVDALLSDALVLILSALLGGSRMARSTTDLSSTAIPGMIDLRALRPVGSSYLG